MTRSRNAPPPRGGDQRRILHGALRIEVDGVLAILGNPLDAENLVEPVDVNFGSLEMGLEGVLGVIEAAEIQKEQIVE